MDNISIENIKIGDTATIKKEMKLEMVHSFAGISEDFNPVHLNYDYASKSRYKKQIIHGLMAASLFSGLFGTKLPGRGCIYKSQELKFKRAIYIGDVVTARIEVIAVDINKKVIFFNTVCLVKEKVMIDGNAEIFIP
jgi:3-hydroxybutyryl-CoA dehydratase